MVLWNALIKPLLYLWQAVLSVTVAGATADKLLLVRCGGALGGKRVCLRFFLFFERGGRVCVSPPRAEVAVARARARFRPCRSAVCDGGCALVELSDTPGARC